MSSNLLPSEHTNNYFLQLRAAYLELAENTKILVCQTWQKKDPESFKILCSHVKLGYSNLAQAAKRPPGVGSKLDRALCSGSSILTHVAHIYVSAHYNSWIKDVGARIATMHDDEITQQCSSILESVFPAQIEDEKLKRFLFIVGHHNIHAWRPASSKETIVNPIHYSETNMTASHTESSTITPMRNETAGQIQPIISELPAEKHFAEIEQSLSDVEKCLETIRAIKLVNATDVEKTVRNGIANAIEHCMQLRTLVEAKAHRANVSIPEWNNAAELKTHLEQLDELAMQSARIEELRTRLQSIVQILESITDVGIKVTRRRTAAENARSEAIKEISERMKQPFPPTLPGAGYGREWFANTFALSPEKLEELLNELRQNTFPSLAILLEELESGWDHVSFAPSLSGAVLDSPPPNLSTTSSIPESIALPPVDGPMPVPAPVNTTTAETQTPLAEPPSPSLITGSPNQQSLPPPQVIMPIMAELATQPLVALSSAPRTEDTKTPQASPRLGISAPIAPTTTSDDKLTCVSELLNLFRGAEDAECLLVPDLIEHLPEIERLMLMPHSLWQSLVWQPWLRNPESDIAEKLRLRIRTTVSGLGWQPQTPHDTLLAWSALFLPALVDFNSDSTAIIRELPIQLLPQNLIEATRVALDFLNNTTHCTPEIIRGGASVAEWKNGLRERQESLLRLCESSQNQRLAYRKATSVLKYLTRKGGRIHTFANMMQSQPSAWQKSHIKQEIEMLRNRTHASSLVDRSTRECIQGKFSPIEAKALEQLLHRFGEFAEQAEALLLHAEREPTRVQRTTAQVASLKDKMIPLLKAAFEGSFGQNTGSQYIVDDAATADGCLRELASNAAKKTIKQVLTLFDTSTPWTPLTDDVFRSQHLARLRVPNLLVYSDTGEVASDSPVALSLLRGIASGESLLDLAKALDARCKMGDVGNARIIFQSLSKCMTVEHVEQLRLRIEQSATYVRGALASSLRKARYAIINARTLRVMADTDAAGQIHILANIEKQLTETEDYNILGNKIERILRELAAHTEAEAKKLHLAIDALDQPVPKNEKTRLHALIKSGDLATTREYINRITEGHPLPELPNSDSESDFLSRYDALAKVYKEDHGYFGLQKAVRARAGYAGIAFTAQKPDEYATTCSLVETWHTLRSSQPISEDALNKFLHDIGFTVNNILVRQEGQNLSLARVETAPIIDREICPIPQFGSYACGRMLILHPSGFQQPEQLITIFQSPKIQRQNGDVFIFMLNGRFEHRQTFARLCRAKEIRAIIIDDLTIAHLAANPRQRLAHFFRATIPWTWANPFVPTTSFVPPEMFYGRREALASLADFSQQRCFVFGGRQLGKSALLREVERRVHQPEKGQYAIWIDLLAAGFGSRSEPVEIWRMLEERFKKMLPGFSDSLSATETPQSTRMRKPVDSGQSGARIEGAVIHWLAERSERRLLLLLDEGDRFFERDGVHDFAEARILKSIMDRTNRSFKVVFAGLHNVQRTSRQTNHPLAHLGEPIEIGAFTERDEWMEAWLMLVLPLADLGYRFDTPDLPSRILSYCNFFPSMLQQFGSRLLQRLRTRAMDGPPFIITESDVEDISRDEKFRQFMVERFHWTLQLDKRYHYLAYTFARLFHEETRDTEPGFTAACLREEAEKFQPDIFGNLSHDETVNLLSEMGGLGILRCVDGNRYVLRNTNVLLMLGTRDEIETRLLEDMPDARAEYDLNTFRHPLHPPQSSIERRLFTRPEEARLASNAHEFYIASANDLFDASGFPSPQMWKLSFIGNISHSVYKVLRHRSGSTLDAELKENAQGINEGTCILVVQSTAPKCSINLDALNTTDEFISKRVSQARFIKVVFVVPPGCLWEAATKDDKTCTSPWLYSPKGNRQWLFPRRWEREFIEPWLQELAQPVPSGGFNQLYEITGCWPRYLCAFAKALRQPNFSWSDAIEHVRKIVNGDLSGPVDKVVEMFMGQNPEAEKVLDAFRTLRGDGKYMKPITHGDIEALAQMGGIPRSRIDHWIHVAGLLGLTEKHGDRFVWEPLFERVLATSPQ